AKRLNYLEGTSAIGGAAILNLRARSAYSKTPAIVSLGRPIFGEKLPYGNLHFRLGSIRDLRKVRTCVSAYLSIADRSYPLIADEGKALFTAQAHRHGT